MSDSQNTGKVAQSVLLGTAFSILVGRSPREQDLDWLNSLNQESDFKDFLGSLLAAHETRSNLRKIMHSQLGEPPDRIIYFNHIPKTAGTSLNQLVMSVIGENSFFQGNRRSFECVSPSELRRMRFVSGHLGVTPMNRFPTFPFEMFSIWRSPDEFWESYYGQCQRVAAEVDSAFLDDELVQLTQSLGLSDWIRNPLHQNNVMLSVWMEDGDSAIGNVRGAGPERVCPVVINFGSLHNHIKRHRVICTVEKICVMLNVMSKVLGQDLGDRLPRANVGELKQSLSKSDREFLRHKHPLDYWFDNFLMETGGAIVN